MRLPRFSDELDLLETAEPPGDPHQRHGQPQAELADLAAPHDDRESGPSASGFQSDEFGCRRSSDQGHCRTVFGPPMPVETFVKCPGLASIRVPTSAQSCVEGGEDGVGIAELRHHVAEGGRFASVELGEQPRQVGPDGLQPPPLARPQSRDLLVTHDPGGGIRAGQARGVHLRHGDRVGVGRDRGREVEGPGRDAAGVEDLPAAGVPT